MLWNEFYRVESWEVEGNRLQCQIQFFPEHEIFTGHFPGQPVVPGVCMMEMVRELIERLSGRLLWLREAAQVKFLSPITPDLRPFMEISWEEKKGGEWKVQASLKEDSRVMFRLQALFSAQMAPGGMVS